MTEDNFAEALRRRVGYYEDKGGLDRETLLAVIEDMPTPGPAACQRDD
jgi:hypothetical protein